MARFAVGQAIRTLEPTIVVDGGLAPGDHRFQLEVLDSSGQRSAPAQATVSVQRLVITPPVLPPVIPPIRPPIPGIPTTGTVVTGPLTPGVVQPLRSPRRNKRSKPK